MPIDVLGENLVLIAIPNFSSGDKIVVSSYPGSWEKAYISEVVKDWYTDLTNVSAKVPTKERAFPPEINYLISPPLVIWGINIEELSLSGIIRN